MLFTFVGPNIFWKNINSGIRYFFEEIYSWGNFGRKIKNVLMALNWGFRIYSIPEEYLIKLRKEQIFGSY